MNQVSIFKPGYNCWRIERASRASILVDYANYYRDLYHAILKARHSLFIVGWDIDGRIELMRGKAAEGLTTPTCLFELLKWKCEQNPDFKVYMNKWDYSIFFAKEREPFAGRRWKSIKTKNFHYVVDSVLPLAASHHQKIVVVDDEVAFCGGMDIALARWDYREHHPVNPDRCDPSGLFNNGHHVHFSPYHDLMMMTAGPAAYALAELVRERWKLASGYDAHPLVKKPADHIPESWPSGFDPDFENVDVAIARTLPPVKRRKRVEEIYQLYLDEIPQAEKFIYIENQFLVQNDIARAINKQMRLKPELRVIAVSCDKPKGVMEKKSMWTPRLEFKDIVESGGCADRIVLVHPISREDGQEDPVRIHSKLMIIDDKFLHLGSANINNRSMGLDTECDQVIIGHDEKSRAKIAAIRTDLIREHSGREAAEIERLIHEGAPVSELVREVPTSRQHFKIIDDEEFRDEKFVPLARRVSDPRRPLISAELTVPVSSRRLRKYFSIPWVWAALVVLLLLSTFVSDKSHFWMVAGLVVLFWLVAIVIAHIAVGVYNKQADDKKKRRG